MDLDASLEGRAGASIAELFAREGEAGFRERESEHLRTVVTLLCLGTERRCVIATGGGVVERPENRRLLGALPTLYLHAAPELLAARVAGDAAERPALVPGGPLAEARALYERRDPLYREVSQRVISAEDSPAEVAALALAAFEALCG